MHLISDMLFLNNSFEDKTLKKVTSLFFYGQSVITLVNLVVFILIISMIYFASWTKKNVFKPVKYKVYKSVLSYLHNTSTRLIGAATAKDAWLILF